MTNTPPPHADADIDCTLCLVRHGETDWNVERRLQGHIDIPLNERGRAQAENTARSLAGMRFAALYTSDLARARQTAAAITRRLTMPEHIDPRLRERHYGLFQGLTYDEAARRHPEFYRRFTARELAFSFPECGESLHAFADRIRAALHEIALRHRGDHVLIVTHGGVLDIAYRIAAGREMESARDFPIPNAALNWIEHGPGGWRLRAWADERHLNDSLDELPNA
jgi:probable phosphoglycerate mutase